MKPFRTILALSLLLTASCNNTGAQQGGAGKTDDKPAAAAPQEPTFLLVLRLQAKLADRFDNVGDYSEGFVSVYKDGKYTFADTNGTLLLPFSFDLVTGFENGYATVISDNRARLIDTRGKDVFPPRPDLAYIGDVKDGIALARNDKELYGFINVKGETVVPFGFNDIHTEGFVDGVAIAIKGEKYGLINRQGAWVVQPAYDNIISFSDGMNVTPVQQGSKWGLLRKDGTLARPANMPYKDVYAFSNNGLTVVVDKAGNKGFIDSTGREIFKPEWDLAGGFNEWNLANVHHKGEGYLIDVRGTPVLKGGYWDVMQVAQDQFIVSVDEGARMGMVDRAGKERWPMEYTSIMPMGEGLFLVKRGTDGPLYYADLAGKKVADYKDQ